MACKKYYLISFSCAILLYRNFNFSYSWALQKRPVFMRNIMKKFWLKFRIHAKLHAQKVYLFRKDAQFREKLVSYWYENDAEFHAKKSFCAKPRNCCARGLFRGNPNPYWSEIVFIIYKKKILKSIERNCCRFMNIFNSI